VGGAIAAAALTPQADAQTRTCRFQTSKNIACLYSSATGRSHIRCDVLSGLRPKPKRPCQVDWTGFSMTAKSRATATCAGDTVYDRKRQGLPVHPDVEARRLHLHRPASGSPLHEHDRPPILSLPHALIRVLKHARSRC